MAGLVEQAAFAFDELANALQMDVAGLRDHLDLLTQVSRWQSCAAVARIDGLHSVGEIAYGAHQIRVQPGDHRSDHQHERKCPRHAP
ncbi:hypothetical protein D9M68_937900 [compost metagenome]